MSATQEVPTTGSVKAALPLALLEAVRAHDRPGEVLEDEDLSISLPRRLGLTGVIQTQLRRYEGEARSGKNVATEEFASLMRLVLKRPDAETILSDTGERMALRHFQRVRPAYLRVMRTLPRALLVLVWRRQARRMLRDMVGDAVLEVSGRPPVVRLRGAAFARLEPPGAACAVYTAALERLAELFTGTTASAAHTRCHAKGGGFCEWTVSFEGPGKK
jgi:predicted hydrocarbon binding protein